LILFKASAFVGIVIVNLILIRLKWFMPYLH